MKKIAVILSLIFMFTSPLSAVEIFAADYGSVVFEEKVTVLQIIDGDSFVALNEDGQPLLIRLIGVDPVNYDASMLYLNGLIMGKKVSVEREWLAGENSMWNACYVYLDNDEFVNRLMIETGNAKIKEDDSEANLYDELESEANRAEDDNLGLWARPESTVVSTFTNSTNADTWNTVNINTASRSDMRDLLGISSSLAASIIDYRDENPFNALSELKYVDGFTQEIYDDTLMRLAVSTNIAAADEDELGTLGLSNSEVRDIIDYQNEQAFVGIEELYSEDLISRSDYDRISPFIALEYLDTIDVTVPDDSPADVNTAALDDFLATGISTSAANDILDSRRGGKYTWKSIGEAAASAGLSESQLDRWADNLICQTSTGTSYVNINTASKKELLAAGFSEDKIEAVLDEQGHLQSPSDIAQLLGDATEIWDMDAAITIYTNINSASENELLSLDPDMTDAIAADIVAYRADGFFGDLNEVEDFFDDIDEARLFRDIEDYIVVR